MKSKSLILEGLVITLDEQAPNQLARITFVAFASTIVNDAAKQNSVRSEAYATISGNMLRWTEQLRVPFQDQTQISFETECEFEYGFKKEQMKSRFQGVIYLKQQFFVLNGTTQVFRITGEKVGVLSYVVKMTSVNPAFGKIREKTPEEIEQEVYQPDFRGRVIIYAATVKVREPLSQLRSKRLAVRFRLGDKVIKTKESDQGRWTQTIKFDRHEESTMDCEMLDMAQGQLIVAKGHLLLDALEKNKRFTIQSISLSDLNRKHIGQLIIDMRFVDKEEVISMRLNSKRPQVRHHAASVEVPRQSPKADAKSHSILMKKAKVTGLNRSMISNEDIRSDLRQYRSLQHSKKVHVMNDYNEIIIPRAKRFPSSKPANPYVSYVDPEEVSVFRPSGKGASIGLGNKYDFTAVRKQNPGVGQYRLPSIWDKY